MTSLLPCFVSERAYFFMIRELRCLDLTELAIGLYVTTRRLQQ